MPAVVVGATEVKVCNRCGETKPSDAFYKRSASPDGLQYHCKLCHRGITYEFNQKRVVTPEEAQARNQLYRERHPEKAAAVAALRGAVKTGRIVKAAACEDCNEVLPAKKLDGHHADYSEPLEVVWLCRGCHMKRHQKELV